MHLASKSVLMLKGGGLTAVGDLIKPGFPEVMVLSVKLAEVVPLGPI